jgi:tRNA A-37 threonylcarbamoyl transferase component Bud32
MKIMRTWLRESLVDENLPQLRELLDTVTMREILPRELRQRCIVTASFDQCRIARVKYRPGRNCLITYQLIDQKSGDSRVAIITVLGCRAGESASVFAASHSFSMASAEIRDLIFHLPELEAVAWIFPADRKLPGLPALTDSAYLKSQMLPQIVRQSESPDWAIIESVIEPVSYFAERSYTARAGLSLHNAQTNAAGARTLYAKTYCVGESGHAWRGQQELWESDERKSGRLFIPQPILHQPEIETIWQEGLNGTPLDAYRNEKDFAEMLERAGEAVAALHRTKIVTVPSATSTEMVKRLLTVSEVLSQVRPGCRHRLQDVVSRLTAIPPESPTLATLHGDLHSKNLLVASGRIALLDLDNLVIGDPLADLGSFAAAIQEAELSGQRSSLAGDEIIERFIRGYQQGSDHDLSVSRLCWWMAAALIAERAWRFVAKLKAQRADIIDDLIELARITADGAERGA